MPKTRVEVPLFYEETPGERVWKKVRIQRSPVIIAAVMWDPAIRKKTVRVDATLKCRILQYNLPDWELQLPVMIRKVVVVTLHLLVRVGNANAFVIIH